MTPRPAPRRSALAAANPITETDNDIRPASTDADDAPQELSGATTGAKPGKVSFYQLQADTERMRGALLHTMAIEGPRSMSAFINQAVMNEVRRLETEYNHGQPFPPVGSRTLPQGRPLTPRTDRTN